jgi:hypothetical protein
VLNRQNAIGLLLLLICAVVAGVLLYGIATGTQFRFTGPSWVGPVLLIVFLGASLWSFAARPGRRWPWDRNRAQEDENRDRDL